MESVIMIIPHWTLPPSFLRTVIALRFFFAMFFDQLGDSGMYYNTFWVCLKQNLVREGLKKSIEYVIMIILHRNRVKVVRSIWKIV